MLMAHVFRAYLALPPPLIIPFGGLVGLLLGANFREILDRTRGGLNIGYLGEMMIGGAIGAALGALPGFISGILGGMLTGILEGSPATFFFGILFGVIFSVFPAAAFGALTGAILAVVWRPLAPYLERLSPPQQVTVDEGLPLWPFVVMAVFSITLLLTTWVQGALRPCGVLDLRLGRSACFYQFAGLEGPARTLAFAAGGDLLIAVDGTGTVHWWHTGSGKLDHELVLTDLSVISSAVFPGAERIVVGTNDDAVRLFTADGRELQVMAGHNTPPTALAVTPDGSLIASGANDRTIRLWQVADGQQRTLLKGHESGVAALDFSPDGTLLASAGLDDTVRLWSVADGMLLRTLLGHTAPVRAVAFSPDGALLASAGNDGSVRLWSVADGTLLQTLPAHDGEVRAIGFTPDGQLLASGGDDLALRLWSLASGLSLAEFVGPDDVFNRLTIAPDGAFLASSSLDGRVQLWQLAPAD
jgi:hypothetical protein